VAIYHPDGVGALQISSYRKQRGEVSELDLREMAGGLSSDGDGFCPASAGEFVGMCCEFVSDGQHWRRWFVARGPVALHITYNCQVGEWDREREAVNRVLASLKCPLPVSSSEG
jgi:hypothetical protein